MYTLRNKGSSGVLHQHIYMYTLRNKGSSGVHSSPTHITNKGFFEKPLEFPV
jgi:hypothetical protein